MNWLRLYPYAFLASLCPASCCQAQICSVADTPYYRFALVRDLSECFEEGLKKNPRLVPIDLALARQPHEKYIGLLEKLVPEVYRLESDPHHPDCNFVEDTAVIVGDTAVISRMGATERRGEEVPVAFALQNIGVRNITHLQSPATMDGGDLLFTGRHLIVGLSKRTNECALNQLKMIFQGVTEVIGVPVIDGLHLKSVISFFDAKTLIVAGIGAGRLVRDGIQEAAGADYAFVTVPDPVASNVLRIGSHIIIQEGFPASETIIQDLCDQKSVTLLKINMSELIKADGALTCGCLLFN